MAGTPPRTHASRTWATPQNQGKKKGKSKTPPSKREGWAPEAVTGFASWPPGPVPLEPSGEKKEGRGGAGRLDRFEMVPQNRPGRPAKSSGVQKTHKIRAK